MKRVIENLGDFKCKIAVFMIDGDIKFCKKVAQKNYMIFSVRLKMFTI